MRVLPAYTAADARWGLAQFVAMLERAARAVRKNYPDAVLAVGHLSRKGGGEIERHASHESGRDADLGFYVKDHLGRQARADHFVAFRGDGTAPSWPGARFDDERNWALLAAMLGDERVRISHIFVASPLRARLLAYAARIGAPSWLRSRAAEAMVQPRGALPHDDHFHVRIGCPSAMDRCVELPTARRRARGPRAVASRGHGHAAHPSHAPVAAKPPVAQAAPSPARPRAAEAPRKEEREEPEEAMSAETFVPSLAPMVPGLDSVVIPAPLDDPDGVATEHGR